MPTSAESYRRPFLRPNPRPHPHPRLTVTLKLSSNPAVSFTRALSLTQTPTLAPALASPPSSHFASHSSTAAIRPPPPLVHRHPNPSPETELPPHRPNPYLAGHSGGDPRKGEGGLWRDAPLQACVPGHCRREQWAVDATGLAVLVGQGLRHMRGDDVDQCARPTCRH